MPNPVYQPLYEYLRGGIVESIHFGAIVVVDSTGRRIAHFGDWDAVTFLRSTAKPLQALPFLREGGKEAFDLDDAAIALMCASHQGTDEHMAALREFQAKVGVEETSLMCGVHPLSHAPTVRALVQRGEALTPNRHNCSGKHTGMLAFARMKRWPETGYLSPEHPMQKKILDAVARMCGLPSETLGAGIDGCSAPNFAMPLSSAALAYARLSDPESLPDDLAGAARQATAAMRNRPDLVGGPDSFDTHLMRVARGRILAKGGAEGFQGLGLMPGALGPGSLAAGIAIKISDGDARRSVVAAVALEVLRQLGALSADELVQLAGFGPPKPMLNSRKIEVGRSAPSFSLELAAPDA